MRVAPCQVVQVKDVSWIFFNRMKLSDVISESISPFTSSFYKNQMIEDTIIKASPLQVS
jgi:hypothetical protein